MKSKGDSEIFSGNEENVCEEYSFFPAEDYKTLELKNEAKEDFDVKEISLGEEPPKKEEKEGLSKFDKLKDKIVSHTSTVVTTAAVAVVSATVLGFVPEVIKEKNPFGTLITDSLVDKTSFHQISIEGEMEIGDEVSRYCALVEEYGKDERKEEYYTDLVFTDTHFSFDVEAIYGLESYRYTLLSYSEEEKENVIYSSSLIPFNLDQGYQGNYQKLKPTETKITFTETDTYEVEINTGYQSPYPDVFQYEVSAVTREGEVLDSYKGTDPLVKLHVPYGQDLFLAYKNISYFAYEEIISEQYMASDYSVVSFPRLSFDNTFGFDGQNFTLPYFFDTIYEFSSFCLYLTLDNGAGKKKKTIQNLEKAGTIVLDEYEGEIGNLVLSGELEFQNKSLDSYTHKVPIIENTYNLQYHLNVTSLRADLTEAGTDYIPLSFEFDYLLPNDYSIAIYNQDRTIDEKFALTDSYFLKKVQSADGDTLSLAILSPDGNEWKKVSDYTILGASEIRSAYVEPTISDYVNPNDFVVTYNDDDTVNVYRKVGFSSSNPNIYLDTMLYEGITEDTTTGEMKYINAKHNKTTGTYSIMEDLPALDYRPIYFINYEKDGITYQMSKEVPSGSLRLKENEPVRYEASYDETSDSTKIIVYNDSNYFIKNELLIDGIYYYFNEYVEHAGSYMSLVPGNVLGKQMTLSMTLYDGNYASYSTECEMKGNRYKTYNFNINA